MINILSLQCSLAFAPYLSVSTAEFLRGGGVASRVIRQGGTGLIVRGAGDLVIRHEGHQASLGIEDARHYAAAIQTRQEFYDVSLMQGEIVQATVLDEVLLSHPQSEIRLAQKAVKALVNLHTGSGARDSVDQPPFSADRGKSQNRTPDPGSLPDWLSVSEGGGSLLLSDQRTGRWVLLGDDHIRELERRSRYLCNTEMLEPKRVPPTITMKGLRVHLQSAFRLASTLAAFASNTSLTPYEELTPTYSFAVSASVEGLELMDADNRITLTAREARKWADIISAELESLNAQQFERAGIRTVIAGNREGCWVLQWGDEVFVSRETGLPGPAKSQLGEFSVILSPTSCSCAVLNGAESECLEALLAAG